MVRKVGHSSLRRYELYQQFSTKCVAQVDIDFDVLKVVYFVAAIIFPFTQIDCYFGSSFWADATEIQGDIYENKNWVSIIISWLVTFYYL